MTRQYSSISVETTLASSVNTTATTITVATGTATALMGGISLAAGNVDIFTIALDVDTVNEEIVFVTQVSGDTLTISRGQAGTGTAGVSGLSHTAGASVKHVLTSSDLIFFRNNASPVASFGFSGSTSGTTTVQATAIAGTTTLTLPAATDTLVGKATSDTLTNKTLTSPIINSPTITTPTQRLTLNAQTGTTYTLVAADASYKLVTCSNAAAITVTVPPSIFTAGDVINLQQIGAGQVTFAQGAGVTITSTGATSSAPKLRAQESACSIICTASNTFTVIGDLS
jgi:hypothetical protein